jgi:hypothetical protein
MEDIFLNEEEDVVQKAVRNYWIVLDDYFINDCGTIDVIGDVKFSSVSNFLEELPLKFNTVTGNFDCSRLSLRTLRGCPIEVGGTFDCSFNPLSSLEYAPKKAHRFVFDNMVKSIYTGDISCDYDEVEVYLRTNDPKLIGLQKILTDHACFMPIIFKYQPYYSWNGELNENQMDELIEDIIDGLE